MLGPLHRISPSLAILSSTPSIAFPTQPNFRPRLLISLTVSTGEVSVKP